MKLMSLIQNTNRLEVAEVEIEFIPGIPQIHFLGLPDKIIKESFYRIKSALKSSGYKFPLTSQMIVNIKPNHLRKSSRGVELAVALGILLKTGQIASETIRNDWVIYGELGLDGSVYEPSDLNQNVFNLKEKNILTGQGSYPNCFRLDKLKDLTINFEQNKMTTQRPTKGLDLFYSKDEAEFIFLAATSGAHSLLAGDSGAGKSTLAHAFSSFLPEPDMFENIRYHNQWRPVVYPHQSITPAAFLGGGSSLYEGEVERAQGGVLLLDEFLEFNPEILEALRGPMTGEKLRLSRAASQREYNAHFQVVATTNLCNCGKWSPLKKNISCRFTRKKCAHYLERLSGPILDRFGLLFYCLPNAKRDVKGDVILARIKSYFDNEKVYSIKLEMPKVLEKYYVNMSARRIHYLTKVAQIYGTERMVQNAQVTSVGQISALEISDFHRAELWTVRPFEQLERGMS